MVLRNVYNAPGGLKKTVRDIVLKEGLAQLIGLLIHMCKSRQVRQLGTQRLRECLHVKKYFRKGNLFLKESFVSSSTTKPFIANKNKIGQTQTTIKIRVHRQLVLCTLVQGQIFRYIFFHISFYCFFSWQLQSFFFSVLIATMPQNPNVH